MCGGELDEADRHYRSALRSGYDEWVQVSVQLERGKSLPIVTGVTPHGTFVRVLKPAVEGLLAQGQQGVDVGDRLHVKLIRTEVQRGFIDFARD